MNKAYDELAWFYDRYWGRTYHCLVFPVVSKLLLSRVPPSCSILDLCCGTGHLSEKVAQQGYRITGIDNSEGMLTFARKRLPGAKFLHLDARNFQTGEKFDGVLSTFESINHITNIDEVGLVFRNVSAALKEGGAFLFDFITEETYLSEWGKSSVILETDHACFIRGNFDMERLTARTEITLFRLTDRWNRADLTVRQRCYGANEIVEALHAADFARVDVYSAMTDFKITEELGVGRCFVLAQTGVKRCS